MASFRMLGSLILAGALLLVGCGEGSHQDPPAPPPPPLDLKTFVAQGADIVCSALASCSCTDSSAIDTCKAVYENQLMDELAREVSVSGRTLDPAAAQTCLDDMRAELGDCSIPPSGDPMPAVRALMVAPSPAGAIVPSCDAVFVGVQVEGEHCAGGRVRYDECASGLGCDERSYTCAPLRKLDETCESADIGWLACTDGLTCIDGACAELPGGDEACPSGECQEGLRCAYSSSAGYSVCMAPHAENEDCNSDSAGCAAGLYCEYWNSGTCLPVVADGGQCEMGMQCQHGLCGSDGKCLDPGICEAFGARK